jgi:hypothetical protein
MKTPITLLFFVLLLKFSGGQTVLLQVDRTKDNINLERGPNLKRHHQFVLRGGFLASNDYEGARIKYGSSVNLSFSFRKKYKIGSVYSLGFDIDNQYTDYKLKQEKGKVLPDTIINDISERLDYYTLGAGFYQRINFDPGRGNFLGFFLDLGVMGEWYYSIKDISKNKLTDGSTLKEVKKSLPYVNMVGAKIYSRIGFGRSAFYGSYRITDLFKADYNYPDLPRFVLGLELAVF